MLRQCATTAITAVHATSIMFTMDTMLGRLVAQLKMLRPDADLAATPEQVSQGPSTHAPMLEARQFESRLTASALASVIALRSDRCPTSVRLVFHRWLGVLCIVPVQPSTALPHHPSLPGAPLNGPTSS